MKYKVFFVFLSALTVFGATVFGQDANGSKPKLRAYFMTEPVHGADHSTALKAASASQMIPLFEYSVTSSRDGNSYQGVMVGGDPNTSTTTTTVPTELVPIILNIGGVVFDPTAPDVHCLGRRVPDTVIKQSPMFSSHSFVMGGTNVGTTQYIDAFQRANFWDAVVANG